MTLQIGFVFPNASKQRKCVSRFFSPPKRHQMKIMSSKSQTTAFADVRDAPSVVDLEDNPNRLHSLLWLQRAVCAQQLNDKIHVVIVFWGFFYARGFKMYRQGETKTCLYIVHSLALRSRARVIGPAF